MNYRTKKIIQCQRCQSYGHSKIYCRNFFRSVKCVEENPTKKCLKRGNSIPTKCILCEAAHPANYKVRYVHKEIFQKKYRPKWNKAISNNEEHRQVSTLQPPKVTTRDHRIQWTISTTSFTEIPVSNTSLHFYFSDHYLLHSLNQNEKTSPS